MTHLYTFIPLLAILLPAPTLAGPASGDRETNLIRSFDYLEELPGCAFDCVVAFTGESFPLCSSSDLDCLCRSNSQSGFTLGEGALRCLASECEGASSLLLQAAYSLCNDVWGARPETHPTIEASMASPETIMLTAETTPLTTPLMMTTALSGRHSPSITPQATPTTPSVTLFTSTFQTHSFPDPTTSTTPSASSSEAINSPPISANEAAQTPMLNKGQIAGVSVAGTIIGAIAIGLLFCLFRSKKGKRRRDSDASFGETGPHQTPQVVSQVETRESPLGVASKAQRVLGMPSNPAQKRWSLWSRAMKKGRDSVVPALPDPNPLIGFDASPISVQSYQTTSRLLPEKPDLLAPAMMRGALSSRNEQPPQPQQSSTSTSKKSTPKQPVRFASDVGLRMITPTPPPSQSSASSGSNWQAQNTSQNALQNQQPLRHQLSDPFIDKNETSALLVRPSVGRRASNKDLPKIITPETRSPAPPVPQQRQPPPPRFGNFATLSADGVIPFVSPRPCTPNSAGDKQAPAAAYSQLPSEDNNSYFSKWKPLRRASRNINRPLTHYTTGSDTSFEDDDDPSPPAALVSALSPVVESPRGGAARQGTVAAEPSSRNGAAGVYYPPVPGSTPSAKRLQVTPQKDNSTKHPDVSPLSAAKSPNPGMRIGPNPRTAAAALAATAAAASYSAGPRAQYKSGYTPPPPPPPPPRGASPFELPDSISHSRHGKRRSPHSPNYSRPEAYQKQSVPQPQEQHQQYHQQRQHYQQQQQHQAQAYQNHGYHMHNENYEQSPTFKQRHPDHAHQPQWQVKTSPGLDGSQETWASPIDERMRRPPQRQAAAQTRVEPPPQRGPWRGKNPPIGSQWLR